VKLGYSYENFAKDHAIDEATVRSALGASEWQDIAADAAAEHLGRWQRFLAEHNIGKKPDEPVEDAPAVGELPGGMGPSEH